MKKMICLASISASALVFHQASADPQRDRGRGPESEIRRRDDFGAYLREKDSEYSFSQKYGALRYLDGLSDRQFPREIRVNGKIFLMKSKAEARRAISRLSPNRNSEFNVTFFRQGREE